MCGIAGIFSSSGVADEQRNAIAGRAKQPHTIDAEICVKCGLCMNTCKFNAIDKV